MLRVLKEALLGFSRAKTMSLFAVIATGFSLFTLGLFMLMVLIVVPENVSPILMIQEYKIWEG